MILSINNTFKPHFKPTTIFFSSNKCSPVPAVTDKCTWARSIQSPLLSPTCFHSLAILWQRWTCLTYSTCFIVFGEQQLERTMPLPVLAPWGLTRCLGVTSHRAESKGSLKDPTVAFPKDGSPSSSRSRGAYCLCHDNARGRNFFYFQ